MSLENGNWCLIESDPGVFTELIQNMGVRDVQVEELYSLDADTLNSIAPVYGLVFLFKWQQSSGKPRAQTEQPTSSPENVYFAQQIINNACATQAILCSTNFRSFSVDLPPDMRGLALTNSDQIRNVHNSFARSDPFISDMAKPATDDDDVFHFISYVPAAGRLYELDGLKPGPIDHGPAENWLERVGEVIQERMSEYSESEIRFNLMAVIGDRRKGLRNKIDKVEADIARLASRLDELRLEDKDESRAEAEAVQTEIGQLNSQRADLAYKVQVENGKFERYKFDNSLRKHNFIPLIYQLAKAMAGKGSLAPAIEDAKKKAQSRPQQTQQPF
ncbi:ubiquitin carboxyl-terminal hydrolase isozyme L5-like protein [Linderina pennispora]|uniref:Ubiquitin carboxyl-terminal hydrolase n=1 Tax=Linderina pennispora TaxID=61395 RepID=A0A1Y1WKN4_9FUNG|nr:ubiquitin carboxyl-terminal hydrolase isozyme L5-like protein [Linderina pennispora]ORX74119.1 ubiquitin carboxyl-terminal hydrolase isozyme L5-like protein [Linderina pennispora]